MKDIGKEMYDWAIDLFPINRSLSGNGVRQTLQYIKNIKKESVISFKLVLFGFVCVNFGLYYLLLL